MFHETLKIGHVEVLKPQICLHYCCNLHFSLCDILLACIFIIQIDLLLVFVEKYATKRTLKKKRMLNRNSMSFQNRSALHLSWQDMFTETIEHLKEKHITGTSKT